MLVHGAAVRAPAPRPTRVLGQQRSVLRDRGCARAGLRPHLEQGDDFGFVDLLVDDLTARATIDSAGMCWSNHEHRTAETDLEPQAGWAMGNAGIVREPLRYARLVDGSAPGYAVHWPDHPGTDDPHRAAASGADRE